jgi:hypothetical protein
MANVLNIVVLPTYDIHTIAVADMSTYDPDPPTTPTLEITVPGFAVVSLVFVPDETNIFDSTDLGITTAGNECSLPDGIYCFKYMVDPSSTEYVEKSIMRVDRLQQKFDEAFMTLDMMECDRAIKTQSKVELNTIWFFIQGSIAAANNCATVDSTKLYIKASEMITTFMENNCGCSGTNYIINFQ